MKDLRVVFMGTPEFSLDVLQMLIDNTNVVLVVTQPDKVVGRGNEVSNPPVKELALKYGIPVFQPEKIRKDYEEVVKAKPDLIVTCAFGQIIPEAVLNIPRLGCVNVHASLLPKLRGGSPLHHALIDGYDETGVTIMYMDKGMDTGDIITQEKIKIDDNDTVGTIHDKLKVLGSNLLLKTLPSIIDGTNTRMKQDDNEATYCHNISHEEELINFNNDCRTIFNMVRGMNPYPVSYFVLNNKVYKVDKVSYLVTDKYQNYANGTIAKINKEELLIKCSNGTINLLDIKKEGKRRMSIKEFLNGNQELKEGMIANE